NDERMQAFVINNLLDTYYHNFITHMLEAEFQRRVYTLAEAGQPLTADLLTGEKYEAIKNFWGDDVEIPESAGLIWMRQPHYYMGLYPYTYSAGLTIATAVAEKIKHEGKAAVDSWIEVLKAGSTLKPVDLAKKVGVDMTKKETIQEAVAYVGSLVDQLEKIYS
ncbi:MAG TPA: M3 family metallopeptidase, partial [Pseudogracilibacillus sp.]|nr:M3 family metallopeptidase [Pseudogracilibacillus sp.]